MKKWLALFLASLTIVFAVPVLAIECEGSPPKDASQLLEYIKACSQKVYDLQGQQQTLGAAIGVLNSKINLAQGQINQTQVQIANLEEEIKVLSTLLSSLNQTLDELSQTYVARVRESYKQRDVSILRLFFSSDSFAQLFTRVRYLNTIKTRDQLILSELEKARLDYDSQKQTKQEKQQEVEDLKAKLVGQKSALGGQKQQKQELLVVTQNDEKKFQSLLDSAKAELEAIEAIIAGKGSETEIGDVDQGGVIAHLITGKSCNSSGTHLHFMVSDKSIIQNPFSYLKSTDHNNYSDGDQFNPGGDWDWPMEPTINLFQGYGKTWAIENSWVGSIYSFHNGIDISSSSTNVKAVKKGKLYQGSYTGSNSCALQYVRVDHADSDIDTYYLHVHYF